MLQKLKQKIEKECKKANKRFGDSFDREQFVNTNPRVVGYIEKSKDILNRFSKCMNHSDLDGVKALIEELGIVCPVSGTKKLTEVRQFNLMFKTQMGATADGATDLFLRPETAQGIFVNFLNVQKTARMKIPFGIAQIEKRLETKLLLDNLYLE